jgi:uncharacterized membrane protein YedE/YeeE
MTAASSTVTKSKKKRAAKPFTNSLIAGVLLGLVLFLVYFFTGDGLGASGGANRFAVWAARLVAPGWVNSTPYLIKYGGGAKKPLDSFIVMLDIGVLLGGFLSAWYFGRLKTVTIKGPRVGTSMRWFIAFIGGTLAGFGARMSRGCTSGQGLNGAATLSVGSWAFLLAFFAGGYLLAYFVRRLWF